MMYNLKSFFSNLMVSACIFFVSGLIGCGSKPTLQVSDIAQRLGIERELPPGSSSTPEQVHTAMLSELPSIPSQPVVVAVIDSGVDIHHEALRQNIYTNELEVNGIAGVDDDGNGYTDDIHGWNFLGSSNGENLIDSTLELTREYKRLSLGSDPENDSNFQTIRHEFLNARRGTEGALTAMRQQLTQFELGQDQVLIEQFRQYGLTPEYLRQAILETARSLQFQYNPEFDPSAVIGDRPGWFEEKGYGNSDVLGGDGVHGTHVAGIVLGVGDQPASSEELAAGAIKIMPLRVVPRGDERDKDLANAIRYATDNGARIINLSLAKPYSPQQGAVDIAVRYAEDHGVLFVHSAGNNGIDLDQTPIFPKRKDASDAWIEVAASGPSVDRRLPLVFTNYGKNSVDLFAPGLAIRSSLPNDRYGAMSGTSMAAPQVTRVAALLWSMRPELNARELKAMILSHVHHYEGLEVDRPQVLGRRPRVDSVLFQDLSSTGGVLDPVETVRDTRMPQTFVLPEMGVGDSLLRPFQRHN